MKKNIHDEDITSIIQSYSFISDHSLAKRAQRISRPNCKYLSN